MALFSDPHSPSAEPGSPLPQAPKVPCPEPSGSPADAHRQIRRVALAAFWTLLAVQGSAALLTLPVSFFPGLAEKDWLLVLLSALSLALVGLPVCRLALRRVPEGPAPMAPSEPPIPILFSFTLAAMGMSTLVNLATVWIVQLFERISGLSVYDPVQTLMELPALPLALYTVLLAPFVEEVIFRGLLLSRLRGFGTRFSVVVTALLFALYHCNFLQMPYAFVCGLLLGYLAVWSGSVWYPVIVHTLINGWSVAATLLSAGGESAAAAVAMANTAILFLGTAFFFRLWRFAPMEPPPPKAAARQRRRALLCSPGMLLYLLLSLALALYTAML